MTMARKNSLLTGRNSKKPRLRVASQLPPLVGLREGRERERDIEQEERGHIVAL